MLFSHRDLVPRLRLGTKSLGALKACTNLYLLYVLYKNVSFFTYRRKRNQLWPDQLRPVSWSSQSGNFSHGLSGPRKLGTAASGCRYPGLPSGTWATDSVLFRTMVFVVPFYISHCEKASGRNLVPMHCNNLNWHHHDHFNKYSTYSSLLYTAQTFVNDNAHLQNLMN